jgi:hypothetical protein
MYMQATSVAPLSAPSPLVRRLSADTTLIAPDEPEPEVDPFICSSTTRFARSLCFPRTAPYCRPLGPLSPFLYDGQLEYRVEGLIGSGTFGRVALATVVDTSPPVRVAIKVFNKEWSRAGLMLPEMFQVERSIMLENAEKENFWLVQLKSVFTDPWNCYLVMVRRVCPQGSCASVRALIWSCCAGLLPKHARGRHLWLWNSE